MEYYRQLISTILALLGTFLIIEHIWVWGGVDVFDIVGHEYYGLLSIFIAWIISARNKCGDYIVRKWW
jgi:hypothetical protein